MKKKTNEWKKHQDSSGEEDEGVDEYENQDEGSLGRTAAHQTTRNGLSSATLPVRVTSRLSVTRTPKNTINSFPDLISSLTLTSPCLTHVTP